MLWMSSVVLAQVNVTPSSSGLPGAQLDSRDDRLARDRSRCGGRWRASCWGQRSTALRSSQATTQAAIRGQTTCARRCRRRVSAGVAPTAINLLFKAAHG